MIFLDSRAGSGDLAPVISRLYNAPPVDVCTLEFGDAMFLGTGPEGEASVGIEIKRVPDMAACIISGRFAGHQLPGMLKEYKFPYLIIEGTFHGDETNGVLLVPRGPNRWIHAHGSMKAEQFTSYLSTVEELAGVRIRQSWGRRGTAELLVSLYHWFQKPWDEHKSLNVVYNAPRRGAGVDLRPSGGGEPSQVMRVAATLPGVSYKRAEVIAAHFPTVAAMVAAPEEEWLTLKQAGIGKITAQRIYESLHGITPTKE